MNTDNTINALTESVMGCAFRAGNTMGTGFLEKVFGNALAVELRSASYSVKQQHAMKVESRGNVVSEYFADVLINECLIIEVKAVRRLDPLPVVQCLNYLKAKGVKMGLPINFGTSKVEVKRVVSGG